MTSNDFGSRPAGAPNDKSLIKTAQDTLGQAFDATVEAVKDHPVTTAAIVGGVAAAAIGARYGITRLREGDDKPVTVAE